MKDPDISVVMSVYNGAEHLKESIDSILAQEGVAFEFIIVNDGSTDASANMLEEYAKRDDRIKIIHQENLGLTKALIRGCDEARGKFIARQDAGDISLPGRLSVQKKMLVEYSELSFVSCWTEYYGPHWEFLYVTKGKTSEDLPVDIIDEKACYGVREGPSHHGSVLFRRDAYVNAGGYRSEFYYAQDWDLWYRLGESGKFMMVNKPLYRVRILPDGISSLYKKRQEAIARLSHAAFLRRIKGRSEQSLLEEASKIRPAFHRKVNPRQKAEGYYFIGECLRRNKDARSITYLTNALMLNPFSLKSWLRYIQANMLCLMGGLITKT